MEHHSERILIDSVLVEGYHLEHLLCFFHRRGIFIVFSRRFVDLPSRLSQGGVEMDADQLCEISSVLVEISGWFERVELFLFNVFD